MPGRGAEDHSGDGADRGIVERSLAAGVAVAVVHAVGARVTTLADMDRVAHRATLAENLFISMIHAGMLAHDSREGLLEKAWAHADAFLASVAMNPVPREEVDSQAP